MLKDKDTQSKFKSSTCLATQSKQEQLIKLHKLTSYTSNSTSSYTSKKIGRCSGEEFVRGIVLTPREPRRATLVERDLKRNKWSG